MVVNPDDGVRANTYRVLGALLANAPTDEVLQVLRDIPPSEPGTQCDMALAWEELRLAAGQADAGALADEYFQLFVGIGRGEVMPYGSWYLSGFMMEKPLAVLREDLVRLGFERREGIGESEDHAAALCETMALVIESGDEVGFDAQARFFNEHMGSWMGHFFGDLQEAGSAGFYRAVGRFGARFVEFEQQYLSMLV